MKKTLLFLLFCFFSFNAISSEQFNFDTQKLKLLKMVTIERGKVTTNNGMSFKANEFEYIKNLNLLKARGNIIVNDNINKF